MPEPKTYSLTSDEVADVIEAFLHDRVTYEEWQEFLASTLSDEALDWMREKCARMPEWYPPNEPGAYCGRPGLLLMRNFVEELRLTRHFIYALGKVGPYAHISDGTTGVYLYPSPIFHDGLALLAERVYGLLNRPPGDDPVRDVVQWFDEPGEGRLIFTRNGAEVFLQVLWFGKGGAGQQPPEEQGEQVFAASFPLLWLASQVRSQMRELIEVHGPDEYKRLTHHDFPQAIYHRLTTSLRDAKSGA